MYNEYASIYRQAGQSWLSLHMLNWLLLWLEQQNYRPQTVLDLGCGTGDAAVALALQGYQVTAIDRSETMLVQARLHAELQHATVAWQQADLTTWQATTKYDLIISLFDTLNYLLEPEQLGHLFQQIAAALTPNGWLVFDLNTPLLYATWPEHNQVVLDRDDLYIYNALDFDHEAQIGIGKIVWFQRHDDAWQRGSETHLQAAYSDQHIVELLAEAGLSVVARLNRDGDSVDLNEATRVVYLVQANGVHNHSAAIPPILD
ncbi:class I SAM-dependent methyltransferase [Herpetosiphon geysericola]|uniref:class I SAM-dependent methyltransferase n=1 Tax=Herpetosiphon geysericola TaxID=70996 RepID=UPI0006C8F176|nr:class I SAM-dependent methyltransferase [Herpetosiphon geysericola]